ncbi:hypothetical protein EBS43_01395 [bacterium]|jgi:hypothetical protein|nr:hypothetical protein [bacterium]
MKARSIIRLMLIHCLLYTYPLLLRAETIQEPSWRGWIEPLIGISSAGHIKVTQLQGGQTQSYFSGLGIGGRAGTSWKNIWFSALDLNYFPALTLASSTSIEWTNTLLGVTVGAHLPNIPMRFWIGYRFINYLSPTQFLTPLGVNQASSLNGTSFKVGTSIELFTDYWINGELNLGSFNSYTPQGGSSTKLPSNSTAAHSFIFLSMSKLIKI